MSTSALDREKALSLISQGDPDRRALFEAMEATESWVIDTPESYVDKGLLELGEIAEQVGLHLPEHYTINECLPLLATIHAGRFFMMIRLMREGDPEAVQALAGLLGSIDNARAADVTPEENIVRLRLHIANQMNYLADLLSSERLDLAANAIEDAYGQAY